jgi:glycosyl transferase family 87
VTLALTQASRAVDLLLVQQWCRAFLFEGRQLYAGAGAVVDYPPNAIILFAPLAIVPPEWLVPVWTAINLSLTALLAYLVVRCTNTQARLQTIGVIALLFLSWGGVRTLLELSHVCLTLAFAAVLAADSRPVTSGVFLGLALAKPQIAGPIWLWTAVTGRARTAAAAILVAAAGLAVYCVRVDANPVEVVLQWSRIVRTLYSGPDTFVGRTSLRAWWLALTPTAQAADRLWLIGASVLLFVPCLVALRSRSTSGEGPQAARALFCLWSLLTVFHLGNNLILMLPAFSLLVLSNDVATRRLRLATAAIVQFAMMFDIPVHLRRFDPGHGIPSILIRDFDRIVAVGTFCCVAFVWWSAAVPLGEVRHEGQRAGPVGKARREFL